MLETINDNDKLDKYLLVMCFSSADSNTEVTHGQKNGLK